MTQKIIIEVSKENAQLLRVIAAKRGKTRYKYIGEQLAIICENERKKQYPFYFFR